MIYIFNCSQHACELLSLLIIHTIVSWLWARQINISCKSIIIYTLHLNIKHVLNDISYEIHLSIQILCEMMLCNLLPYHWPHGLVGVSEVDSHWKNSGSKYYICFPHASGSLNLLPDHHLQGKKKTKNYEWYI